MDKRTTLTLHNDQSTLLRAKAHFPECIKKADIRIVGKERTIASTDHAWDSFFLASQNLPSKDFMRKREQPPHEKREAL